MLLVTKKITNVNHMTKLEMLDAYGYCEISDEGISGPNLTLKNKCRIDKILKQQEIFLISLNLKHNSKVININHLICLRKLAKLMIKELVN